MSNSTASRQTTSNKQVRFRPEPPIPSSSPIATLPMKVALESVKTFAKTLYPILSPVVWGIGKKHIMLFKNLHCKNKSHTNLKDDEEIIPRTINVLQNFKL